ncbi:MAG: hypothetical protein KBS82_05600 [Oscillospiraceae bacterium]|nr:hypothetical protein [Candidatus Limimonas egerieequi]
MEEKKWKLYVHINKYNEKCYFGITSKDNVNHRWNSGRGYKENPYLYQAITKYGWDGFDHIVIFDNLSEHQAKELEKMMISFWGTQNRVYGYNMTSGGDGTPGYIPSEETRRKLSEARRRENLSEETLRRRSEGLRGRKFSDDHRQKIGKANSKKINMYDKDGNLIDTFVSAQAAERELHINHSHISQCCNGKRKSTGGYMWSFAQ